MKDRASKQEDVCDRKQKLTRDERILKQKLIEYEKQGLNFYTDQDESQMWN